jgi:hypothetical protein
VCCWIEWLLMIKNCLIESGPPCIYTRVYRCAVIGVVALTEFLLLFE